MSESEDRLSNWCIQYIDLEGKRQQVIVNGFFSEDEARIIFKEYLIFKRLRESLKIVSITRN